MDKMTLGELLDFIDESIDIILERFKPIGCVDDFHGLEKQELKQNIKKLKKCLK